MGVSLQDRRLQSLKKLLHNNYFHLEFFVLEPNAGARQLKRRYDESGFVISKGVVLVGKDCQHPPGRGIQLGRAIYLLSCSNYTNIL